MLELFVILLEQLIKKVHILVLLGTIVLILQPLCHSYATLFITPLQGQQNARIVLWALLVLQILRLLALAQKFL